MPLETQIIRDGHSRTLPWDYYTLSMMYSVAFKEGDPDFPLDGEGIKSFNDVDTKEGRYVDFSMVPIYYLDAPKVDLVAKGRQTVKSKHRFEHPNGKVIVFQKGDILCAGRVSKN